MRRDLLVATDINTPRSLVKKFIVEMYGSMGKIEFLSRK